MINNKRKTVILLDMDNTIYDFSGAIREPDKYGPEEMLEPYFFYELQPFTIAKDMVDKLWSKNFDLYICTRPLQHSPKSYSEKARAILRDFPYLWDRIIMLSDKGMVKADYLIDDDDRYAETFDGEFIHFDPNMVAESWIAAYNKIIKETNR